MAELARALNLMNESYLLDAFGREPRISDATAIDALTEIWVAVIRQRARLRCRSSPTSGSSPR